MKLTFYGLWEEEKPKLQELSEKYGFEYAGTNEVLCPENLSLCDGSAGVSALGKRAVDETLLSELARRGIRYLSTRSIGYNHIDLKAAKKFGIRLCNSQYPPDSVAEFTVMLMLMALRKKILAKDFAMTACTPSAFKTPGACSLEEPQPKFSPPTTKSPGFTFFAKSGSNDSNA